MSPSRGTRERGLSTDSSAARSLHGLRFSLAGSCLLCLCWFSSPFHGWVVGSSSRLGRGGARLYSLAGSCSANARAVSSDFFSANAWSSGVFYSFILSSFFLFRFLLLFRWVVFPAWSFGLWLRDALSLAVVATAL